MVPNMQILRHTYFIICLLAALFVLPAFFLGPHGGDSLFHLVWSQEFAHEFWRGNLYPRWLSRMNSGCGGPDLFYYYPLPYYLTTLFSFLDNPAMPGWYPLLGASWASFSLMGIFCYLWLTSLVQNKTACLCGAMLYMFFPTTITNYETFSYTSFMPQIWLPLLLYSAQGIAGRLNYGVPLYAFAMAGLYTSSINSVIAVAWVPVIYCLYYARYNLSPALLGRLLLAIVLGTALATLYLWPMLHIRPDVAFHTRPVHYSDNFTLTLDKPVYSYLLYAAVIGLLAWKLLKLRRQETIFWLTMAGAVCFMMSPLSTPVWELFPILQIIHFPWRFGAGILPAIIALFAIMMMAAHPASIKPGLFAVCILISILPGSLFGLFKPMDYYTEPAELKHFSEERYYRSMFYHFRRVQFDQFFPAVVGEAWKGYQHAEALDALCTRKTHVESGSADISITEWRSRHIELQVDARAESTITVSQFNFPGWIARDADKANTLYPIALSPEGTGLVTLAVPPGQHRILLEMPTSAPERYGAWISAFALTILIGILLHGKIRRRTTASPS